MNGEQPHFLSRAPRFEPPVSAAGVSAPPSTAPTSASARPARRSPHSGRSPRRGDGAGRFREAPGPDVALFAERALRLTLEVIDRRRTPGQLRRVAAPAVVDVVHALARSGRVGVHLGTATLERVRVRPVRADAAEVFGTYNRGGRVFAIAARIERGESGHPAGWAITSVRIA